MQQWLDRCMTGNFEKKHILPFFWQHGETRDVLEEEINAIKMSGIDEFCVESRVHPYFCEDKWWEDFQFLLDEAEKRKMRVWLLDDKKFPTGYANNYIKDFPDLRKVSIRVEYRDFYGPSYDCSVIAPFLEEGESYISVTAFNRKKNGNDLYGIPVDLMPAMSDGLLRFDIPDGIWRVYFIIKTFKSPKGKENYIDVLSKESCRAMINAVYQPHFDHFGKYFGNTFAGFFSDEPGFNNDFGCYDSKLGKEGMLIPWNDALLDIFASNSLMSVEEILLYLPSLWHNTEKTSEIRQLYMDAVSKMYSENFSFLLGDWCRDHNVMYIGHIIEDMNTHMRLGHGAAHYFRALDGQDMAGVDVVLHQIIPGINNIDHTAFVFGNIADTEFYNYALAKLASSHAHIQSLKKGRAMCEIYGAYGWAEGLCMQKRLADHMLVRGINYFVPHAFNPKYPDNDCPPFFYAGGNNPQFELFSELMTYMQRCCFLLSNGEHIASVAILYNAEAEWSGGKYIMFQKVAKQLMQNQIDFDIIHEDALYAALAEKNNLKINNRFYNTLVIPYCEILPYKMIETISKLSDDGVFVIFTDGRPAFSSEKQNINGMLNKSTVVDLDKLADFLRGKNIFDIVLNKKEENLRIMHSKYSCGDVFMFVNEDTHKTIDAVLISGKDEYFFYDAWDNKMLKPEKTDEGVRIKLEPGESIFLIKGYKGDNIPLYGCYEVHTKIQELTYDVSIKSVGDDGFTHYITTTQLFNLTARENFQRFCGTIRYETEFYAEDEMEFSGVNLGIVGETAKVWINGEYCGVKICRPYVFDFRHKLKKGKNKMIIETINNPGYKERDVFSTFLQLPPSGVIGPVSFIYNK